MNEGTPDEREVTGFYMDGYLKENLDGIPMYLKQSWDCVGIVSGHGLVGVGKSTIASQVSYYLAWLQAGGRVISHRNKDGKWVVTGIQKPTKEVRFNLKENVVFSAEELQDRAKTLYEKYGKGQVIQYDEGRQGLDSSRAMESINKGMEDFFQECRVYGHIIIIVLPNYFKLHEDYAVARSLFLIDCFTNKNLKRGYFNFYNIRQKENLYYFGKKRIGVTAKYNSANESFWGRFTRWMPFNAEEYEKAKTDALAKKRQTRWDKRMRLQRDAFVWMLNKDYGASIKKILERLREISGVNLSEDSLYESIKNVTPVVDVNLAPKIVASSVYAR